MLCHEKIWFPTLPGNVMNAWTYNFPVQFQLLSEVDNKMIFVGEKAAYERILEGCKELKKYGVRAVTGACGFITMLNWVHSGLCRRPFTGWV